MNEEPRKLINYRVNRAEESIEEAVLLFNSTFANGRPTLQESCSPSKQRFTGYLLLHPELYL